MTTISQKTNHSSGAVESVKVRDERRTYVVVGTGGRVPMYLDPIVDRFRSEARIAGLCDSSKIRMEYHLKRVQAAYGCGHMPLYSDQEFDRMLREQRPDVVIVCTPDATHHDYIVRSLLAGCDVVCEKPITTDAEKCLQIRDAVEQSGRNVRVAFNYRWAPGKTQIKELIQRGEIGEVKHVSLDYLLDTRHGADYFRRWHSTMANSGGLLVHKASHHFDLVNWWTDAIPENVFASGRLAYYGEKNAIARGDKAFTAYDRYTDNARAKADPFYLDLRKDPRSKGLYFDAEGESQYIRDRNVFRDDIDIYDSMSALVEYRNGMRLNYSLHAFCPYEGFRVSFTGDKGRLEFTEYHSSHLIVGQTNEELSAEQALKTGEDESCRLVIHPLFGKSQRLPVWKGDGAHGGADPMLQEQIFSKQPTVDLHQRNAGHEQGLASALVGIAANASIISGRRQDISALCPIRTDVERFSDLT